MNRRQPVTANTTRGLSKLIAGIALSAVLVLTGCATSTGGSGTDSASAFHDLNGQWELFSATDVAGAFDLSSLALLGGSADVSISLTLTDGKLTGNVTCNAYSGSLSGLPDALTVDGLSQTERACTDMSLMKLDERYFAALGAVTSAKLGSSAGLILLGDGISLSFVPVLE